MERARSGAALLWWGATLRWLLAAASLLVALLFAGVSPAQEEGVEGPPAPAVQAAAAEPAGESPADSSSLFAAPTWVALRSLVIPGWGQATNGAWIKALFVTALEAAFIERLLFEDRMVDRYRRKVRAFPSEADFYSRKVERHKSHRRDFIWWTSFVVALSMGDAYVDAHLRRFDVRLQAEPVIPESSAPDEAAALGLRVSLALLF